MHDHQLEKYLKKELKGGPTKSNMDAFHDGNNNMMNLVTLSLYKMSEDGDLFGFDDILPKLKMNLGFFSDNKNIGEWIDKFNQYAKEHFDGNN